MSRPSGVGKLVSGCALALSFLTVLPVRVGDRGRAGLEDALIWFPLVGALLGALAGAVRIVAEPLLGSTVASVLALLTLVASTGALHLDGLADAADALGVGDRERRLEVMRDAAVGAFGALALLFWALLFLSALTSLSDVRALRALVAATTLARCAALWHAAATPAARTDGLGAAFDTPRLPVAIATALAVLIAGIACGPLPGLAAIGAAVLTTALSTTWARKALEGRTGDTLGATISLTEPAIVLTLLAIWHD